MQPQSWDSRFTLSSSLDQSPIVNGTKATRSNRRRSGDFAVQGVDLSERKDRRHRREGHRSRNSHGSRKTRSNERERQIVPSWSMNNMTVTRPTFASKSMCVQQRLKHTNGGPPAIFSNHTISGRTTEYNQAGYVGMATAFTRDKPTSLAAGMCTLHQTIELALRTRPRRLLRY